MMKHTYYMYSYIYSLIAWLAIANSAQAALSIPMAMEQPHHTVIIFNLETPLPKQKIYQTEIAQIVENLESPLLPRLSFVHMMKPKTDAPMQISSVTAKDDIITAINDAVRLLQHHRSARKSIWLVTDKNLITESDPIKQQTKSQALSERFLSQFLKYSIQFNTLAVQSFKESQMMLYLAKKTNGTFEINTPKQTRQTIQVNQNQFVVDRALKEAVVQFDSTGPVSLKMPNGQVLNPEDNSEQVYWVTSGQSHHILLKNLLEGIWTIQGEAQNAHVEYLSDMAFVVQSLDQNIFLGEVNKIYGSMVQNNQRIQDPAFIQKMKVYAMIKNEALEETYKIELNDNARGLDDSALDGVFSGDFAIFENPGVYHITVIANALGIQRKAQQKVFVHNYPIQLIGDYDIESRRLSLTALMQSPLLDPLHVDISMRRSDAGGRLRNVSFKRSLDGKWYLDVLLEHHKDIENLQFFVTAKTQGQRVVSIILPRLDAQAIYASAKQKAEEKLLASLKEDNDLIGKALMVSNERRKDALMHVLKQDYPKKMHYFEAQYPTYQQELLKVALYEHGVHDEHEENMLHQDADDLAQIAANHAGIEVIVEDTQSKTESTAVETVTPEIANTAPVAAQMVADKKTPIIVWVMLGFTLVLIFSLIVVLFYYLKTHRQRPQDANEKIQDTGSESESESSETSPRDNAA